jgi:hypothetical protein
MEDSEDLISLIEIFGQDKGFIIVFEYILEKILRIIEDP